MQGRLVHASYSIPAGKGLLSPLVALVTKHASHPRSHIPLDPATKRALLDWQYILCMATKEPTLCTDLIPTEPDFIGYCNASKLGAGGVWFGAAQNLPPIVWHVAFPIEIQNNLTSVENLQGTI